MKHINRIFTAMLIGATLYNGTCSTNATATVITTQSTKPDCTSPAYRRTHPLQCASFAGITPIISGVGALGGALALIGMSSSGGGNGNHGPKSSISQPTMTVTHYNMVGNDVDNMHLASITGTSEYSKNATQYNDIRLGYSLARGFTGAGTTIAVLDSGTNHWHGATVAQIAGGTIAPNAQIESYQVSNRGLDFISYNEIGNVIASAKNANVYNSSWSVSMRATDIYSRAQMESLTDKNFINQISVAATQRDAIFVWAAGNDYSDQSSALSALPRVMPELNGHFVNVVAYDSTTGELAQYSNACGVTKDYCITAPGSGIDTGTRIVDGTSFAAPVVSAAIAVIREAWPYLTASDVTELLFTTARDLGDTGVDETYGHGMLDLERATRPVGTALVAINDTTIQPLTTARVAAPIAHNIKNANIQLAFFDSFGRPFTTNLSDNIRAKTPSRALEFLRADKTDTKIDLGSFEMGFRSKEFLLGDGFLKTQQNTTSNYVGISGNLELGSIRLFGNTRIASTSPRPTPDSMVSDISTIYTADVRCGAKYNDWTFAIAIPDAVVDGTMNLRLPSGRGRDGAITYSDTQIDLATKPVMEYSLQYKNITATFVDNPYGTDEIFIVTKGRIEF